MQKRFGCNTTPPSSDDPALLCLWPFHPPHFFCNICKFKISNLQKLGRCKFVSYLFHSLWVQTEAVIENEPSWMYVPIFFAWFGGREELFFKILVFETAKMSIMIYNLDLWLHICSVISRKKSVELSKSFYCSFDLL